MSEKRPTPGYVYQFTCWGRYHVWPGEADTCQCGERTRDPDGRGPYDPDESMEDRQPRE